MTIADDRAVARRQQVMQRFAEHLDELEEGVRAGAGISGERIVRISNGFRLQETEEFTVEVWKMLYNWRLVVMPPRQQIETTHGYCYFGTDLTALARAVGAGLEWTDPLRTAPAGFDKQAF